MVPDGARRPCPLFAALMLAVAGCTAGADTGEDDPAARPVGIFNVVCTYSHTANADPIAMPGMPGMAMSHDFFGNAGTDAHSTGDTLLAQGDTTCTSPSDHAAYWVPTAYRTGKVLPPTTSKIYYQCYPSTCAETASMPVGLQLLAGNKSGQSRADLRHTWFSCAEGATATYGPADTPPTTCPAGSDFQINFRFPDCWDGNTLEGATQDNARYSGGAPCPEPYPVRIPEMVMHVRYAGSGRFDNLRLSTAPDSRGSVYTAHADFLNAWQPDYLSRLVVECNQAQVKCGTVRPGNPF